MATQKDNLLVSLLKRSVGMSSGASGCCCGCGSSAGSETAQAPAPESATPPAAPKPDADTARPSDAGRSGCC